MKRLLMLKPDQCASGDTYQGKIYDIIEDTLVVYNTIIEDGEKYEDGTNYEYTKENVQKYSELPQARWITIKDESSEDSFEYFGDDDDRCILCENDRELAYTLIERVEGLDTAVVNMAMSFNFKNMK